MKSLINIWHFRVISAWLREPRILQESLLIPMRMASLQFQAFHPSVLAEIQKTVKPRTIEVFSFAIQPAIRVYAVIFFLLLFLFLCLFLFRGWFYNWCAF